MGPFSSTRTSPFGHWSSLVKIANLLMTLVLVPGLPGAASAAPDPEVASFGALSDGTLTPDFVTSKGGLALTMGTPVVFHSYGSQASEYPAGFTTVAGPFTGAMFDSVVMVFAAHNSAPASVDLRFQVKNGTTGELITELPAASPDITVSNIPLDTGALPGDPPGDHCQDELETAGTLFEITLAPPVNSVLVGPTDDLQLIITPTAIFGGDVEICVDYKGFYTSLGLVVEPVPVPNQPPVAALSAPAFVEATSPAGAMVTLDASGSSDPDGDPLNYVFSGPFGTIDNGSDPTLDVPLPFSPPALASNVSVEVSDPDGESDTANATVTVQDTTPPSLTPPPDISVSADGSCMASPDLDTPTASDIASPPVIVTNDAPPTFPLGDTTVTWMATDASGNAATAGQSVTVVDTTAPILSVSVSPDLLWPPNHKLVSIAATVEATDNCDPSPAVALASVTSSEPDNGLGDGNTAGDIQGADLGAANFAFELRAERSGGGSGRVYTIVYSVTDASGNAATASATVTVPKAGP
jgi:hypothetical protein